jgi:hypothetical protein
MIQTRCRLFYVTALLLLLGSFQSQAGELLLGAGASAMRPYSNNSSISYPITTQGYGGGVYYQFFLASGLQFRMGAVYWERAFQESNLIETSQFAYKQLQIPLTFHFHLWKIFNGVLGGYLSRGLDSVTVSRTGATPRQVSWSELGLKTMDYGALVGFDIPIFPHSPLGFFLQALAEIGLSNLAEAAGTFRFQGGQAVVGIRLGKESR